MKGSSYHINQCIVIFLKAINLNENNIEDEEEDFVDAEKTKKNILSNKNYCLKIIKFNLRDIPELLQINFSKVTIKSIWGQLQNF